MIESDQGFSGGEPSSLSGHASKAAIFTSEVLSILKDSREATLATLRPDGWPQATIINFVNDETQIFFACGASSQKVDNISRDSRISLALVAPYSSYGPIFGLSLAGSAKLLEDVADISYMLHLWTARHPYMQENLKAENRDFKFYSVSPIVVTVLDYKSALGE
jgi:general stress protein 26